MEIYEYTELTSRLEAIIEFDDMSDDEKLSELVNQLRPYLRNVIGATIGKGGEGKTTLATNLAYMLAEEQALRDAQGKSAKPILYMELDHNGDGRLDLGLATSSFNDDGKALRDAITNDGNLKVVRNVRPFLDATVSGKHCADIAARISKLSDAHSLAAYLMLALLLAQISHLYRWIVLDFAPGDKAIQRTGLAAATHLVAPIRNTDNAALGGLGTLTRLIRTNRRLNPEAELTAIAFVGFRKVKGEPTTELLNVRAKIETLITGANMDPSLILDEYVRDARAIATLCRNHGRPAREFALAAAGQLHDDEGKLVPRPRDENGRYVDAEQSIKLAEDYSNLARGVIARVRQRNNALRESDNQMQGAS
ncbi:ParA family protein [Streptomyces graminilatus]|uniref:ParA family protein n=1 Tax=Streptomyces graminilatus TaxID=1464070 RepID=UPI0006E3BD08|nr:ParA family protein [Streptomyces graminilatus]